MRKLKNILLVDDDEVTNFINAEIIESLEATEHVDTSFNGKEALDFLDRAYRGEANLVFPELLFLDINMPVMDGFEFLKEFRKKPYADSGAVIITMLTTSLRTEDMERAQMFEDVVSGYIEKPLTRTVVLSVLDHYFAEQHS